MDGQREPGGRLWASHPLERDLGDEEQPARTGDKDSGRVLVSLHTSTDPCLAAVFGYVSERQTSGRDYVAGGETEGERPLSAGACQHNGDPSPCEHGLIFRAMHELMS